MEKNNFESGSKEKLDIIHNMIFVLPIKFNHIIEVAEEDDSGLYEELENHKTLCYYVTNNGLIDKNNSIFKRPDYGMQQYSKPFFVWAKVENVGINKVLVDGGDNQPDVTLLMEKDKKIWHWPKTPQYGSLKLWRKN